MTSVVVADDQELVRSGLRMVLEVRGVEVLGEAGNGREAIDVVEQQRPDVVLMDIRMPVLDGIAATRELVARAASTRVLVLTTYDLDEYVYGALRVGAAGFLLKATPPERLVAGIETVAAGEALLSPNVTRRLIEEHIRRPPPGEGVPAPLQGLTDREREVLVLMARGLSNDEIAAAGPRRRDGQDAREPGAGQARPAQPGAGGGAGVRERAGAARRVTRVSSTR